MKKILATLLLLVSTFLFLQARDINIEQFGAVADGKTVNTKAIQKAIDACADSGGGRVIIPNGIFISGTIRLKDNVALYLEPSAILKGSPEYKDYDWEPYDVGKNEKRRALISGRNLKNIAILGQGTIDGNGGHKNFQSNNTYGGIGGGVRPFPVSISHSVKVQIKDVTIKDGAFWDLKLDACNDVLVDGVTINSRIVANNDGIDIIDCFNVRVANCNVNSGDDGICLKSNTKRGVRNAVITNCIVKSESNGIKLGAVTKGGFENVAISNCVVYDTRLAGLALEMVDGGVLDKVTVSNITMHNVNGSIFMKCDRRQGSKPSAFRNVIVSNIIADGIGNWKADTTASYFKKEDNPRIGMILSGKEDCIIENVTLSNIHLQFAGGETDQYTKAILTDHKSHGYPEYNNFGVTPAYGINCKYVKDLHLSDIKVSYRDEDARPAFYFEDSENVTLNSVEAKVSDRTPAYIRFNNQNGAVIMNNKPKSGKVPFCSFEGKTKDISLMNNDSGTAKELYIKDSSVDEKQIKILN